MNFVKGVVNFTMSVNEKYLAHFECGCIYHVYNKTNNKELLFQSYDNYLYFLKQYYQYISPVADTFAWNLLPDHFHFLIRIKSSVEIIKHLQTLPLFHQTKSEKTFLTDNDINAITRSSFKRFFTSYAMAYNNLFKRTGNLFYRRFKRVEITQDTQFTQALVYIHANAQKHKLVKEFKLYPWTSYHAVISEKPTKLLRNEVLEWFGGKERFITTHQSLVEYYYGFEGAIEDDTDM